MALATIAAVSGALALLLKQDSTPGVEITLPTPTPPLESKVHVSGAVRFPGVYVFEENDRLEDVVNAAGGLLPDADVSVINLAARLRDEQSYHLQSLGETPSPNADAPSSPEDGLIDINSASADDLTALPGIGAVRASAIVAHREAHGPFSAIEDILDVDGIGLGTYREIRGLIRVIHP